MRTHISAKREVPYTTGVGPFKGPGSSRVLDALSCYLSLIFKHPDTKWKTKKYDQNGGGGGGETPAAPPGSAISRALSWSRYSVAITGAKFENVLSVLLLVRGLNIIWFSEEKCII